MNVVVIGAQWGDEGKGKMVDYLAREAQIIIRYSGGANAGHTIVIGTEQYALHLIPSGILYPDKIVILGAGMVIDPTALFAELEMLKSRGIDTSGRVFISDRAHLVLPRYIEIDKQRDKARKKPIGTTGRGIGITYAMKAERDGIRIADLDWKEKMDELEEEDRKFLAPYVDALKAMAIDLPSFLASHKNAQILFEGAQGTLLDLDLGTYPYVSSGMSCAAGAAIGGCVGPRALDKVLGVFKAYSTRVGNGPFPSEFDPQSEGELERFVRETGREYGVTTGRPRRCGYLDLVALRYACRTNSIDSLIMTHLDVYDTMEEIKACVAYRIGEKVVEDFPASIEALSMAKPILRSFPGWKKSLKSVRTYRELPAQAREYIEFIERYCETPVSIVSVGYEREETIIRTSPWTK
ncbi:MAG TPA: adenylosuccinate synthase [Termitinemataceae bacterium]|uniref:adenylosuccinate synthase n=1 Tax=Treponema sp. J25 TaxID=2094121 RepID=UPI0010508F39|nr:adenylosuccinate synthase [Treponema sp. J25]TCW62568.1 adenylosuccinate synthase [Treponema sp. J25]HOJ98248.1 adenylosuccinate synthase [Termitinemataceae bacterium]HOM22611.1 adenylosuccinate synthase [Termitinemataceae bacterium]HPP99451.1 adenylosuccinate synthase [Termitinemataceae bacterium]